MRRQPALLAVASAVVALVALSSTTAPSVLAADCGMGATTLQNGGFEVPVIGAGNEEQLDSSLVPPWKTTDGSNLIEIWGTGFNGVPAAAGGQFVEVNATTPGTLYQDVVTTPGVRMTWSIQHRGRAGSDTMKVLIGDAATADVNSDVGWNFFSPDLTDDTSGWGTHTADYVVPAGQTCTRFGFRAVSSANGNQSVGNFLDAAGFSIFVPPTPSPSPSLRPTPPVTDSMEPAATPGDGPSGLVIGLLGAAILTLGFSRARSRYQR
jgi:hypothetical protein